MTARWSITDLSIQDADGSYVTTISESVTPDGSSAGRALVIIEYVRGLVPS